MGFSLAGPLGVHVSLKIPLHRTVKFPTFSEKRVNFKLTKAEPQPGSLPSMNLWIEGQWEASSAGMTAKVKQEIEQCYELIHRIGRGVVYLGSSRMGPNHPHYTQALELGREVATLLDCASWSGAGPGLMDAATKGALQAGKPVGGLKIGKEAGEWVATAFHPYLPSETYLTCRFFSARKHGLVDAAVRSSSSDRTAVIALPGGIGTLDEVFEILALIQLERIGSLLPVPFLLMNYDSFYSKLLDFLDDCKDWGTLSDGEVASLWKVCDSNSEALAYLADFYDLSHGDQGCFNVPLFNPKTTLRWERFETPLEVECSQNLDLPPPALISFF
ncbi:unnamed protein product [Ilex paraguariensis]|uniref:Cytokinin riboside 5'-monophosphate phosphoribohydrolase n=1 Tax=Ilex paraguariensis TaxID=185542 RepID=A0ABC8SKG0_9AQUA